MDNKRKFLFLLCLLSIFQLLLSIKNETVTVNHSLNSNESSKKTNYYNNSDETADNLNNKIKIFCIILTSPKNHIKRAIHQKNTWIKRCDNYIFGSARSDQHLKAVKVCHSDKYHFSMCKFKNAIKYAWKNYGDKYDWYIKADDDTYVIMENLREYLKDKNPNEPSYHGWRMNFNKKERKFQYFSGGAGYVMSKKAVKLLVEKGIDSPKYCRQVNRAYDDVEVGFCFKNLGVKTSESTDSKGKQIFNVFAPQGMVVYFNNALKIKQRRNPYPSFELGLKELSDYPVTFHRINGEMMYALEYLFYGEHVKDGSMTLDKKSNKDFKIENKIGNNL